MNRRKYSKSDLFMDETNSVLSIRKYTVNHMTI